MLRRQMGIASVLMLVGVASSVTAQQAATRPVPMRPPLFFSESWRSLPTPPDDHNAWPAGAGRRLQPESRADPVWHVRQGNRARRWPAKSDTVPHNLWTGTTTSPSAAALRIATTL